MADPVLLSDEELEAKTAPTLLSDDDVIAKEKAGRNPNPTTPPSKNWYERIKDTAKQKLEDAKREALLTARTIGPVATGAAAGAAVGAPIGGVGAVPGAIAGAGAMSLAELVDAVSGRDTTGTLMDKMGLPRPETPEERMVQGAIGAGVNTVAGAGTAGQVAKAVRNPVAAGTLRALGANPGRQAAAAVGGSLAGQGVAESGGGETAQTIASLMGSVVPGAAEGSFNALAGLTPEKIAARRVASSFTNPERSFEKLSVPDLIEGSKQTTAQKTRDPGAAELSLWAQSQPGQGGKFEQRFAEQQAARNVALQRVAPGEDGAEVVKKRAQEITDDIQKRMSGRVTTAQESAERANNDVAQAQRDIEGWSRSVQGSLLKPSNTNTTTIYRGGTGMYLDDREGTPVFFTTDEDAASHYADKAGGNVIEMPIDKNKIVDFGKLPKKYTEEDFDKLLKKYGVDHDPYGYHGARNQLFGLIRSDDQLINHIRDAGYIGWKAPEINPELSYNEYDAYAIHPKELQENEPYIKNPKINEQKLTPLKPEDAGEIIRARIEQEKTALETARDKVTAPLRTAAYASKAPVDVNPMRQQIAEWLKVEQSPAQQKMLETIDAMLAPTGKEATPKSMEQLDSARRAINAMKHGYGATGQEGLADHYLSTLAGRGGMLDQQMGTASPKYKEYLAKYAELSRPLDPYSRGTTGTVLKKDQYGTAYLTPDSRVAEKYLAAANQGIAGARDFLIATKKNPEAMQAMRGYIAESLGPEPTPDQLKKFMVKYGGSLRILGLDKDLGDIHKAGQLAVDHAEEVALRAKAADLQAKGINKAAKDTEAKVKKSVLGTIINQDPDKYIDSIMNSKTRQGQLTQLVHMVRSSPEALAGLRQTVKDSLFNKFMAGNDYLENPRASMAKQMNMWRNNMDALVQTGLFTKEQMSQMGTVLKDIERAMYAKQSATVPGISPTHQLGTMGEYVFERVLDHATTIGAAAGGVAGGWAGAGAGVVTGAAAQYAARAYRNAIAEQITNAMLDPEIAKQMVEKYNAKTAIKLADKIADMAIASVYNVANAPKKNMETQRSLADQIKETQE